METLWVQSADGVVDFAKLSLPAAAAVEIDVADSTLPSLVLRNFHLINSTHISIGSNVSYSLSEPIELPLSAESYTGPVLDRMMLPSGLKSLTIIETPKSGSLARMTLPSALRTLEIHLTGVFTPVDEMHLPSTLTKLVVRGEHNCSLELLKLPPSLTHIDTGSSVQPVDNLQTGSVEARVVSRSTRQLQTIDTPFEERLTLTSSHPMVSKMHAVLPRLQHVSVILDRTMWQSVGDVWCKLLLEGRVHAQTLFLINTTDNVCMRDFGEVLYRSDRLGRPLCDRVCVVGETFDYASCLRVSEAIRKVGYDLQVDIDYATAFPACALHRVASVLGAGFRDGDLAYHSQDTNVEYDTNVNTLSFTKVASPDPSDTGGDNEETHVEDKPITLYSWQSCGFCKEQEAIIEDLLEHGEGDTIDKFHRLVAVNNLQNPQDAGDERIKMFPTWVINGALAPGLKQKTDIETMLNEL